jgi:23S rRNA (uracil1939-C5)-methyltransferase
MTADVLTIKLEKLVYGGDSLGRLPDGHVRAELIEILEASPERIAPKCTHFGTCGGCQYQHLAYDIQLTVKTAILKDQLMRIGKIAEPPVKPMIASPNPWKYRNHVQFHLTQDGKLGYVGVDGHSIVPLRECHLMETELDAIWRGLQFEPGLGLDRVSLRQGAGGEVMMILESPTPPELEIFAGISVVHLLGDDAVVMAGDDHLVMEVNEHLFRVSAGAFFQVNTSTAGQMVSYLLEHLPVSHQTTMLDLYCGVGLFSAFFARRVKQLVGIEASAPACEDFSSNLDEFDNVALYQAAVEETLPHLGIHPDAIILDPPRAGLDRRIIDTMVKMAPKQITYVSCDPSTLARDTSRLVAGGYRLVEVTPFDMFPQTQHIESISIFENRGPE